MVCGALACGNIEGETLEPYKSSNAVEFGLCCFLEPGFPAVRLLEAERGAIGRALGVDTAYECLEPIAVVRVHPREKVACGKILPWIES